MPIEVRAATAERWDDLATLFGRRGAETLRQSGQAFLDTPAAISCARNLVHAEPAVAATPVRVAE